MKCFAWRKLPGAARQVTKRGYRTRNVVFVADESRAHDALFREQRQRFGRRIESRRLTANHIRLLVIQHAEGTLEVCLDTVKPSDSNDASSAMLRRAPRTDRPYGGNAFLNTLKSRRSSRFHPLPIGRPLGWRRAKLGKRRKETRHEHGKE